MFEQLTKLCEGLVFISETDAPLVAFRGSVGLKCPYEIADFETVVNNQIRINADWQPLKDFMTENLAELKVIKSGTIEIDVYGVGCANGELFGFKTKAVET